MNRFTEEQMRRELTSELDIKVPAGVSPVEHLSAYLGASASISDEMPGNSDVDDTVIVTFE